MHVLRRPFAPIAVLACAALLAGCGGSGPKVFPTYHGIRLDNLPKHKVFTMNWLEAAPDSMIVQVKRLEVGPTGWSAKVGFRNISKDTIIMPTGGQSSPVDFGLGVFISSLSPRLEDAGNYISYVKKVTPLMPPALKPGEAWNGTFSSPEPPRAGRYLRLVFGVFFWKVPVPAGKAPYFLWVTQHGVQAPPRQGAEAAKQMTVTGSS